MLFAPDLTPLVISVGYEMPPSLIPYIPEKRAQFERLFGTSFMSPDTSDTDRIWYLEKDWKCLLKLDVGYAEFTGARGWFLDLASIPGTAESIEKRDNRQGLVAATIHDMMFAVQFPHFDKANSYFYQVMRLGGTGRFRAWYKWASVQSIAGREAWEKSANPIKVQYESNWLRVNEVPIVSPTHRHLVEYLK